MCVQYSTTQSSQPATLDQIVLTTATFSEGSPGATSRVQHDQQEGLSPGLKWGLSQPSS